MSTERKTRPLPPGWRWARLGNSDVATIIMGQSPPGHTYVKEAQGLPFFQGKVDFGEVFPTVSVWCTSPLRIAQEGDVLISVRAPVGPVNLCPATCCIGRGLAAIRPQKALNQLYLFHYLRSIESKLASTGSGSTFGAIGRTHLESLPVPLPPLSEQKHIAAQLSEQMAQVERARRAAREQLEAVDALPGALMEGVFGGFEPPS